jgi:mono/diheme cytochrome c family protein
MKRTSILSIFVAAALAAGLTGCRGWETDKPPVHLNWNMDTQEKTKAYRKETLFADGRMMRMPVEGTVSRGHLYDNDHRDRGVDVEGKSVVKFPEGMTPEELVARGGERYQIYCTPCHGRDGDGKGPVAKKGGLLVPPPDLLSERIREMENGKIYQAIQLGVNNGNMPSYAAQIPVEDRWAIVAWIRDRQGGGFEPAPGAVVLTAGPSVENGKALYKSKGCNACHSVDGSAVVGPSFKGLWGKTESTSAGDVVVDRAYFKESILEPMAKIVTGFPPAMPPQALTDDEIESLALYVETLK